MANLTVIMSLFDPYASACALYERTLTKTDTCRYPGIDNEMLYMILETGRFNYVLDNSSTHDAFAVLDW